MTRRPQRYRGTRHLLLILALLVAAGGAYAVDVDPFLGYLDLRANAIGGYHAALADDFSVLFSNPAGLAVVPSAFSAARIDVGITGPVFDMANLILSSSDLTTDLVNFLTSSGYQLYTAVDVSGPLSLGYVGDGLGFGIFNSTHLVVNVASITSVKVSLAEDLLIVGGYAFRIPTGKESSLDIGLSAKGYVRGSFLLDGGLLDLTGLLSDPTSILGEPFVLTTGIGVDAGLRWNWKESIAVGLVCRDAFSPSSVSTYSNISDFISNPSTSLSSTDQGLIAPDLEVGLMFRPKLGKLSKVFDEITILADYDDILDLFKPVPRNAILNVDLGVELKVLQVLAIRLGIREALPQAGVDFNLDAFKIGVSAWGKELGYEPGERPVYNLAFAVDFVY